MTPGDDGIAELDYNCACGETIEVPNGGRAHRLSFHWREQCPDPPSHVAGTNRIEDHD